MYEIVSDMSTRQDAVDDRLSTLEDKMVALQEQLELLPDLIATRIQAQVLIMLINFKLKYTAPFQKAGDVIIILS